MFLSKLFPVLKSRGEFLMILAEGLKRIAPYVGKRFSEFLDSKQLLDLHTNKGNVGQILELLIGLPNSSRRLDFEDGELKTNKCDRSGNPKETIFITQVGTRLDEVLARNPFEESYIFHKIRNVIYVPVCKEGSEASWMFLPCIHVNLEEKRFNELRTQLERDYYKIVDQLKQHIESSPDGYIHTSNGSFIQVRSKDSQPYNPIYSQIYGRYVSNKNHAFYFKKEFMKYLQDVSPLYPFRSNDG